MGMFRRAQAAEKAVKALHLSLGQEAWGCVVARLLRELPLPVPKLLVEEAKVLNILL
jgi:HEPN domain-containing protein